LKFKEITVGITLQAIEIYQDIAYEGMSFLRSLPDFGSDLDASIVEFLDCFEKESQTKDAARLKSYILRLGNKKYPFMKLAIQEHLIENEFIFMVDTHDDMFNIPTPDFDELQKIRGYNLEIKKQIEETWTEKKIPTLSTFNACFNETETFREDNRHTTIMVVDDDQTLGESLVDLLKSRGFKVERRYDGIDAVRDAEPHRHDLIIMDNEMKIMDGLEACKIIKEDPLRRYIPIMIVSAGNIDFPDIADAVLGKPFHKNTLFQFINHLLKRH